MSADIPSWVEVVVAALLVSSGVFVLISAVGFSLLQDFFVRMHPPALVYTFGSWSVALAAILHFSMLGGSVALHPLLIIIIIMLASRFP